MVRTILVPIDGSALSEQAVPYATTLAKALGAKLVFMRAVLTAKDPSAESQRFNEGLVREAEEHLRTVARRTTMTTTRKAILGIGTAFLVLALGGCQPQGASSGQLVGNVREFTVQGGRA